MKNLDQIAEDLFNKIRGRFDHVTIGDDEGKVTNDPTAARFFDIKYRIEHGKTAAVSIALFDDKLSVVYNQNLLKNASEETREKWFDFLNELRFFSKRRLLAFDTRNITKTNLDRRDYKFLAQDTFINESMTGSRRKSYQKIGEATLSIIHTKNIDQEQRGSRTRNISKIFIESPEGERFKYPYKHLNGARAMVRHVSEGGTPYDEFGQHIIGLSEELYKLNRFKRAISNNRVMAEGLREYYDIVAERVANIKNEVAQIQKESGYSERIQNYEKVIVEELPPDIEMDWVDQLTVRQFNEELKDLFPYIYRLVAENRKTHEHGPEQFLEKLEDFDLT